MNSLGFNLAAGTVVGERDWGGAWEDIELKSAAPLVVPTIVLGVEHDDTLCWPWYHCNRWQYQFSDAAHPIAWNCVDGRDPDADWGDCGTWNLTDPIAAHLSDLEKRERAAVEQEVQKFWGQLLRPGQLHP